MPMIRIVTHHPYTTTQKQTISDIAQLCMEQYFATPQNDRFHIFEILPVENIVVDANYWVSRPRTQDFIQFYITAGRPRTAQQKSEFMAGLTERMSEAFKIPKQDVMIVIVYNQLEDWSFGEGIRGDLKAEQINLN